MWLQRAQGEPEFERLKRELDEAKHQPRSAEGAYRSAAEMERHRHQLEVQTAFREQGARLQATYDKKQKAEYDMAKRWVRQGPDLTTYGCPCGWEGGQGVGHGYGACLRDGGSELVCDALTRPVVCTFLAFSQGDGDQAAAGLEKHGGQPCGQVPGAHQRSGAAAAAGGGAGGGHGRLGGRRRGGEWAVVVWVLAVLLLAVQLVEGSRVRPMCACQ